MHEISHAIVMVFSWPCLLIGWVLVLVCFFALLWALCNSSHAFGYLAEWGRFDPRENAWCLRAGRRVSIAAKAALQH